MAGRVKVIVQKGLGSYANLFQPRPVGTPPKMKYSIAMLFDKKDAGKALKDLRAAIEKVAVEKWGPKAVDALAGKTVVIGEGKDKKQLKLHNPIKDGDVEKPEDDVYAGKYFFNTSTDRAPIVRSADNKPVIEDSEAYSGCTFNVSVNVFPFDRAEKKGISLGLNGVQVVHKGERLGGSGVDAEEEFKEFASNDGGSKKDESEDLSDIE